MIDAFSRIRKKERGYRAAYNDHIIPKGAEDVNQSINTERLAATSLSP